MRINHVTLLVRDKEASKRFYADVLGLSIREDKGLWVRVGEQYLHLTDSSGAPVVGTFYHFAIEMENLPDFLQGLQRKGVAVSHPDDGRQNFIRDPDGNLIELIDANDNFFK